MSCDITAGLQLGCRDNTGGIKAVYIYSGSFDDLTITEANGAVTEISGAVPAGKWFKYELQRGTSDFTDAINGSVENQTVFYAPTVNVVFAKMQSALRNQVKVLADNPKIRMIVETNNAGDLNDKFFLVGRENGLTLDAGSAGTGTGFGDLNGYTLPFVGAEPDPSIPLSGSNLAGILNGPDLGF